MSLPDGVKMKEFFVLGPGVMALSCGRAASNCFYWWIALERDNKCFWW